MVFNIILRLTFPGHPDNLARETLTEIINVAHMLQSLSSATSLLATTLEQVTTVAPPVNIPIRLSQTVSSATTPHQSEPTNLNDSHDRVEGEPIDLILDDVSIEGDDGAAEDQEIE
jgi:hypothetical protein